MRQLMISLDKKILDKDSAVARRMIQYGKNDELFIIIPNQERVEFDLSPTVHVFTSWGKSKLGQFWQLYGVGERILKKEKIDLITAQDPFFMGLTAVWLKWQFKLPIEIQVHGDFFSNNYHRFKSGPMNHMRWHIGRYVVRRADVVRTVGERVKQSLLKIGIEPTKIGIRPILLNTESATTPGVVQGGKTFVWAGRMEPEKNLLFLVDVFSEVVQHKKDLHLILVGEGSQKELLQQKVKKLKLESNITFVAWLPSPIGYIKNVQALLLPSLTESYGAVAMEAHAVGTPVIMNDVGVANYELKPSDKVKILPINDREKWIKAILDI